MKKQQKKLWGRLVMDPEELAELKKIRYGIYKLKPADKAIAIKNLLDTLEIKGKKFDFQGSLTVIDVHLSAAENGLEIKRLGLSPGTEVLKNDRPAVILNVSYQNTIALRYTDGLLPKNHSSVSPFNLRRK